MARGHRVNIVYRDVPGARFDWIHYLNEHLPLACGVSSRHAPIAYCDVDRPLTSQHTRADAIVCICSVYFGSAATQSAFRRFFAERHPDSNAIIADEPNFTDTAPSFNAGTFHPAATAPPRTRYRIRLLFDDAQSKKNAGPLEDALASLREKFLAHDIHFEATEFDRCDADVPENSDPQFGAIWSAYTNDEVTATRAGALLRDDPTALDPAGLISRGNPLVAVSRLEPFDLALCAPYLEKTREK